MRTRTCLLGLLALMPLLDPRAPHASVVPALTQDEGLRQVILKRADLVLDYYHPQHVSAGVLHDLAGELAARWFYISDSGSGDSVQSLRVVGRSLLLYDTREEVDRLKKFLASVDIVAPGSKIAEEPPTVTAEYLPRFLSLDTVRGLVERHVMVNFIEERGVALFEGYPDDLQAALVALKTLDVAPRQVFLTCQLIEVDNESSGAPLPKELSDNLQRLLPGSKLSQVGMAMLRTSVGPRRRVSMRIEADNHAYLLGLTPLSFDGETRSMTVENCVLMPESGDAFFDTNVVLRSDEYTVLGTMGTQARLLVMRLSTP